MSTFSSRLAARMLRWWVGLYTAGLSASEKSERRDEIDSNHYEHTHEPGTADPSHGGRGWQVLGRMLRGLPGDVTWRLSRPGAERRAARGGLAVAGRGGGAIALVAYRSYVVVAAAAVALVLMVGLIVGVVLIDRTGELSTGQMAQPRYAHSATLLEDGRVLVAGGRGLVETWPAISVGNSSSAEIYDAFAGTWSPAGDMREAQSGHTTTLLTGGGVLVAGGLRNSNAAGLDDRDGLGMHAAAEIYDPFSDAWSPAGSMKIPVVQPLAIRLADGRVLFAGGWATSQNGSRVANVFDPSTNSWTLVRSMEEARAEHAGVLLSDGSVLVVGGIGSEIASHATALSSAERYDPTTDTWTSTHMAEPRTHATATLLQDGRVLVTGGFNSNYQRTLSSAEMYDPSSDSWSSVGGMHRARARHAASLLADGRVLVTGGRQDGLGLSSAEIFDPSSGAWSTTGDMSKKRTAHTSVVLSDGRVLAIGGWDRNPSVRTAHASSEVYDPATGTWSPR